MDARGKRASISLVCGIPQRKPQTVFIGYILLPESRLYRAFPGYCYEENLESKYYLPQYSMV
jgi:hypothetical protein